LAILGFTGVTAIEVSVEAVTNSKVVPLTPPSVALIADDPTARADARPVEEMVATDRFADVHVTALVRFCVVPSV
jgi:hypothetical protein